jgi:hypothetical protein
MFLIYNNYSYWIFLFEVRSISLAIDFTDFPKILNKVDLINCFVNFLKLFKFLFLKNSYVSLT